MSTGKVILGTVAGLAIGGVLGNPFAPEKGSVTRKQIMDKENDYVQELKSKYNKFADSIAEKFQSTKEDALELAHNGEAKLVKSQKSLKNKGSGLL